MDPAYWFSFSVTQGALVVEIRRYRRSTGDTLQQGSAQGRTNRLDDAKQNIEQRSRQHGSNQRLTGNIEMLA
jgi:hypothetical protein